MKISVITATYNSRATIREAIESVLSQSWHDVEYIVIDGGSRDGTLDILEQYRDRFSYFVSEPDKGIYDALNKGIRAATGDIVGFLHSDDLFEDENVLASIVEAFKKSNADAVYGDLLYVRSNDPSKVVRYWKSGTFRRNSLTLGWMPPHPTFYVKRNLYESAGYFDTSFRISADYESVLRFLGKHRARLAYVNRVLVRMRVGGASNRSISNIIRKSREDWRAQRINGIGGVHTLVLKNLSKIGQFIKRRVAVH